MEELIDRVEKLKELLNESEPVQELIKKNKEIIQDEELLKEIEEYQRKPSEDLKEKIIKNSLFREYKKCETDCNLLILEINKRLKKIVGKERHCS